GRAALEVVADAAGDGETEVSVYLPRAVFPGPFRRYLRGRTSERIATLIGQVPNATATIVPFVIGHSRRGVHLPWRDAAERAELGLDVVAEALGTARAEVAGTTPVGAGEGAAPGAGAAPGTVAIASLRSRQRARVAGRVRSVRVQPRAGISSLECTLVDDTGQLLLVFQGRRLVPGIEPGARLLAEGMVGERARRLAMINPSYTILASPEAEGG
ncbi:MAG TPA: OB-fold nucleic acid binding domain-containing protein, partial [Acidimicrobiales bacterium]|nr:OB-fold nucleic acid binding domain-containing protein [Acidimicrobiales bacterium]